MDKYDRKKAYRQLYAAPKQFTLVDVPPLRYLAVDGHGDPNTAPQYAAALEALYAVAYAVKFVSKKALGKDVVVAPLEGLWRAEDMTTFVTRDKNAWDWTMMIAQPDWITEQAVADAITAAAAKKGKPSHGLTFNGDHHEIYLSDARRTEPAKLKTILRQPVRTAQPG